MIINTNILIILLILIISLYFISYFQKISFVKESFQEDFNNKCKDIKVNININEKEKIGEPKFVRGEVVKEPDFKTLLKMYEEKTPCDGGYKSLSPEFWDD